MSNFLFEDVDKVTPKTVKNNDFKVILDDFEKKVKKNEDLLSKLSGSDNSGYEHVKKPVNKASPAEDDIKIVNIPIEKIESVKKNRDALQETIVKTSKIVEESIPRPIIMSKDLQCLNINSDIEKFDITLKREDFANFIEKNKYSKNIDVSDAYYIEDFSILGALVNVEQLDITNCKINDFSFLSNLKNLKALAMANTSIKDLSVLKNLTEIEVLNLKLTEVVSLNGIENCVKLKDLNLFGCVKLKDITAIKNCKELKSLDLTACSFLKDITPIENIVSIKFLNLNYTVINNFLPIKNLINLEFFTADYNNYIFNNNDANIFSNLVSLKFLNLRNKGILDLNFLSNLTNLRDLNLSGNMFKTIEPLENLIEMRSLNLSTNIMLVDIYPLHRMTKLEILDISGIKTMNMSIKNIDVVENMPNLKSINANFNKEIGNIEPLRHCQKLEDASFNDCLSIADITPLRFCFNIKNASFENNVLIKNYSFLRKMNINSLNLAKTSIKQIYAGMFTSCPSFKVDENPESIIKIIFDYLKNSTKIAGIINKWLQ
ncbi:MAG: hypothetical protein LBC92_03740 [Rickettsiales bacterium]|jgi:hypothetical protein|nr:hypothetical protein [Rickettsiales bacterium]